MKKTTTLLSALFALSLTLLTSGLMAEARDIYVIAHRANDASYIEEAFSRGANALECDVRYGSLFWGSNKWYVDHDGIFPWSQGLDGWLAAAESQVNAYGSQVSLIIFDIKSPTNLANLRSKVRARFPGDLKVLYSIGDFSDREAFRELFADLRANEFLAVDYQADPLSVQLFFAENGISNFWYGNGICAGCIEPPEVEATIKEALLLSGDEPTDFKSVYAWTYADYDSIRHYLQDVGVDGIFVNGVNPLTIGDGIDDALNIIAEDPNLNLATRN